MPMWKYLSDATKTSTLLCLFMLNVDIFVVHFTMSYLVNATCCEKNDVFKYLFM
jgi:hypothetical protein